MGSGIRQDVFTAREVARAAGVPERTIEARIASGHVHRIPGTRYLSSADALILTREVMARRGADAVPAPEFLTALPASTPRAERQQRMPAVVSFCVHSALAALVLWLTAGPNATASTTNATEPARMVFLVTPGPGGGGGGGGTRSPRPAPRLERRGPPRPRLSVPAVKPDPVMT